MELKLESKIGARFKLIAHKGDGVPTQETEWFHNLVLDTGLNQMSVGTWINRCCVGAGNSTPAPTQTSLDNFIASTTDQASDASSNETTTAPYYWQTTRVWRFDKGVAAGNLSEVGLGWGNANLWNRALIRDINGNPATITVLADEYLDVLSEIRVYPAQSFNGSFNLLDKNGNIVSTHTYTGMPYIFGGGAFVANKITISKTGSSASEVFTGGIGNSVTELPSNSLYYGWGGFDNTYPTPRTAKYTATFDLGNANSSIRSFLVPMSGAMKPSTQSGHKIEISPPITKLNTQIMTFTFEMSWGRYEPT